MEGVVTEPLPTMTEPAVAVTYQIGLSENRSLVLQSAIERDAPLRAYDGFLDKLADAAERQRAKLNLIQMRVELAQEERLIAQMGEDLERVENAGREAWEKGSRKGPYKPTDAQAAQMNNSRNSIKAHQMRITTLQAEIEACERTIRRE